MVSRTGQAAGSARTPQIRGVGPPGHAPQGGGLGGPWGCRDSPTWTASLASSWGWDPGSSLCSCVSAGTKPNPLGLKLSSFPASSPEKIPLLSCHGDKSPLEGLSAAWHIQSSPRADPGPVPRPQVPHPTPRLPGSQQCHMDTHVGNVFLVCSPLLGREALWGQGHSQGWAGMERDGGWSGKGL